MAGGAIAFAKVELLSAHGVTCDFERRHLPKLANPRGNLSNLLFV